MKGIILEKENDKIVVLTKDGKFVRRKITTNKEIGDEINISSIAYKKVVSIAATLILIFTVTFGSYVAYAQPYGYVQVEGNSGVELTYNRQLRVIKVENINENQVEIDQETIDELKGKKIEEAIGLTTSKVLEDEENTVVITCTTLNEDVKEAIENELQQNELDETEVIIFDVKKEDYQNAKKNNTNPAKEKLKQKLSEKNISEEELKDMNNVKDLVHKINEIRKEEKRQEKINRNKNNKDETTEINLDVEEDKDVQDESKDKENSENLKTKSDNNKKNKSNENKSNKGHGNRKKN